MSTSTLKTRVSTQDLIATGQIGWVFYQEGDAELAAKVIRPRSGLPFISLPTAYRRGAEVKVINYPHVQVWEKKRRELLREFQRVVGDEYFRQAEGFSCPIGGDRRKT